MSANTAKPEFQDASVFPDIRIIEGTLNESFPAYTNLIRYLEGNDILYDWRFYTDAKNWLCTIYNNKKTIAWLSAWKGYFKTTVYLSTTYRMQFENMQISIEKRKAIIEGIENRKNIPCTFEIRRVEDLNDLLTVMEFKIINT